MAPLLGHYGVTSDCQIELPESWHVWPAREHLGDDGRVAGGGCAYQRLTQKAVPAAGDRS